MKFKELLNWIEEHQYQISQGVYDNYELTHYDLCHCETDIISDIEVVNYINEIRFMR